MENAIMRNVKNTAFVVGRTCLMALVLGVLLVFLFSLGEADFCEGIVKNLDLFGIYVSMMLIFAVSLNITMMYMPVVLSFPSRRKDFLVVKCGMSVAVIIVLSLVISVISSSSGKFRLNQTLLTIAGLVMLSVISNVCGIIIMKFGMAGYMIFIFVCGFIGGICGFLSEAVFAPKKSIDWTIVGIVAVAVSILLFILFEVVEWKIISKYEVKR